MLFFGTLEYGRERNGVLGNLLNSHPFALKHLMPAMMSFYIGEYHCRDMIYWQILIFSQRLSRQVLARSSMINSVSPNFWWKSGIWYVNAKPASNRCSVSFSVEKYRTIIHSLCRRNIAYILKAVWNNPSHREALSNEARSAHCVFLLCRWTYPVP